MFHQRTFHCMFTDSILNLLGGVCGMQDPSIVLISEDGLLDDLSKCIVLKLPHPRSSQLILFLWNRKLRLLYELQYVTESYRSWFLGSTIKSEGGLYLCTPFDPMFLLLSAFKDTTRYTALNALLMENGDLSTVLEELPNFESRLLYICDTTVVASQTLYRYSKDRALEWLSCRVNKLADSLSRLDDASAVQQIKLATNVTSSKGSVDAKAPDFALDSTEARLVSDTKLSPKTCQKFAYQLVADYLVPDLAAELSSMLGLKSSCLGTLENVDPQASEVESVSNGVSTVARPTEDYSASMKKPAAVSKTIETLTTRRIGDSVSTIN
ncbi:hypothetical protein CRM22_010993 [Opisthorchis felineus]|uniref:Ribonuclease H2 subunit B n=1 Tax=Opisthorchis felineus TaxID=147828 RepID=A0A4S2KF74_OPIFE|nr:hypothetical protein CRM22_010993 [Opisthorchis felineus]